jgi:hypothetical protein
VKVLTKYPAPASLVKELEAAEPRIAAEVRKDERKLFFFG